MSSWGGKTGRLTNDVDFNWYDQGVYHLGYPLKINSRGISYTTSLATAKKYIDKAVAYNSIIVLLFHNIVDSVTISDQWATADFEGLLDYIEFLGLQTLTIDEYYRLNSGPITVTHK